MRFSAYVLTFTLAALSASAIRQALPFNFKHVFSAQITITPALPPIIIPGGAIAVEPITSGKISGCAVNGTIQSGFAYPSLYNNKTLDVPSIALYGTTSDNQTFYVSEMGVGTLSGQVTRIVCIESYNQGNQCFRD